MALPKIDPREEFDKRLAAAKARVRWLMELNRLMCEVGDDGLLLSLETIAERLKVTEPTVWRWLRLLGWSTQPTRKRKGKPYTAMPWREPGVMRGDPW